jgi:hypothetical protein
MVSLITSSGAAQSAVSLAIESNGWLIVARFQINAWRTKHFMYINDSLMTMPGDPGSGALRGGWSRRIHHRVGVSQIRPSVSGEAILSWVGVATDTWEGK